MQAPITTEEENRAIMQTLQRTPCPCCGNTNLTMEWDRMILEREALYRMRCQCGFQTPPYDTAREAVALVDHLLGNVSFSNLSMLGQPESTDQMDGVRFYHRRIREVIEALLNAYMKKFGVVIAGIHYTPEECIGRTPRAHVEVVVTLE